MVKNPPANAGDIGSIPGLGKSPGVENGNLLQYPCLGNPMNRETWQITVLGVTVLGTGGLQSLDMTENSQHRSRLGRLNKQLDGGSLKQRWR